MKYLLKSHRLVITLTTMLMALNPFVMSISAQAQNQPNIKIGLLECNVEGGIGYIFGSKKQMVCIFKQPGQTRTTSYKGSIMKFGLDIGFTTKSSITWAVFAPSNKVGDGDLAGTYGGLSAEATTGLGIGANVLLGGLKNSIALQPLSIQNQEGVNVAAGVSELKLTFMP